MLLITEQFEQFVIFWSQAVQVLFSSTNPHWHVWQVMGVKQIEHPIWTVWQGLQSTEAFPTTKKLLDVQVVQ